MNVIAPVQELGIQDVSFSYGNAAVLSNISLRARAGQIVAIVGPNGCGKSTLLRLIIGRLAPSHGQILLDNQPLASLSRPALARKISLVPQQMGGGGGAAAAFGYTVQEMVLMARHAAHASDALSGIGFETAEDLQLAQEALWAADVHHLADRPLDTLSGGERQRVVIARAFTQQTPILLLDEPTSALDLHHQLELMEQLRRATKEQNRIAILVTHDLNLALAHADRTAVLDRGRLVAEGPTSEVLTAAVLEPVYRVSVRAEGGGLRFFRDGGR